MSGVTISPCGAERIDDVMPLWHALHEHHTAIAPQLGAARSLDESWARRRRKYEAWFRDDRAFLLLAEDRAGVVGYAMVRVVEGSETWQTPDELAELETLCVLPRARGTGVGTALMHAVFAALRVRDLRQLSLGVIAGNDASRRFYEKWGLVPVAVQYRGAVPAI